MKTAFDLPHISRREFYFGAIGMCAGLAVKNAFYGNWTLFAVDVVFAALFYFVIIPKID